MDRLLVCARGFEKLLHTKYRMVIGRKGVLKEITLTFTPLDFHHLMGLGKLKDLHIASQNRQIVFDNILRGRLKDTVISKSRYYDEIVNRFSHLFDIETILDSNELIFRYNRDQQKFSKIEADYLLSTPHSNVDVYLFINRNKETDTYFCRSFFPREDKDYTVGQAVWTLLYKEKIDLLTGKSVIQLDKLSPR
ncbi:MAG: hypothetical protein IJ493_11775 [Clostridia bacterium]|nr:hypothetical protein [Clostridia bacterium]